MSATMPKCTKIEKYQDTVVLWIMLLCTALAVAACKGPAPTPTATPTLTAANLRIDVLPMGATVYINDIQRGHTPLTLHLSPGSYVLRVQHEGYDTLQRAIRLQAGQQVLITDQLLDSAPPVVLLSELPGSVQAGQQVYIRAQAQDNGEIRLMRLLIDGHLVIESTGKVLEYIWDTKEATNGAHTIIVTASDIVGNVGQLAHDIDIQAVALPKSTPTPESSAAASTDLSIHEASIVLSTYPYEPYLKEKIDAKYNFPVIYFDRSAYQATNPQPQQRLFKAVILENRYLRLTFLPELGGRLYSCIFKPSGQNIFYQNSVLKPSYWGPLNREENWWLAAGGMEWALPVEEHGYEWGVPWTYSIEHQPDQISIILRDSAANDRLRAAIKITLPSERAYFVLQPQLVNPTSQAIPCQFWINAALTLGSASIPADTEFIYPTDSMLVHSTGDKSLPAARQILTWPIYNGRDLSYYGNWHTWLGVFVPDVRQNYVGAYNHDTELGIARIFPPEIAQGLKLFAFGADFPACAEYCDDGSKYFEIWGGPCRTFWPEDDVVIGAGQSLSWSEAWVPFTAIGGLDKATTEAIVKATVQDGQVHLGIAVSKAQRLHLSLKWNGQIFHQQWTQLTPDTPIMTQAALPDGASTPGQLTVQLQDTSGTTILEYTKAVT